jgi:hypothetical protein
MSELTIDQLERLFGGADTREEDRQAMEVCDFLEQLDAERAADAVEEVLDGWRSSLTGYPLEGFESPRYVDERK